MAGGVGVVVSLSTTKLVLVPHTIISLLSFLTGSSLRGSVMKKPKSFLHLREALALRVCVRTQLARRQFKSSGITVLTTHSLSCQ